MENLGTKLRVVTSYISSLVDPIPKRKKLEKVIRFLKQIKALILIARQLMCDLELKKEADLREGLWGLQPPPPT